MALAGALTQLISPMALNEITDYMDTYDSEEDKGIPLVVVVSVAGLFLGQVFLFVPILHASDRSDRSRSTDNLGPNMPF